MSKTWDELSNDAFKLVEDLYNDMIARGIEIDPKTKSKYEELSKLRQPTVISSVCISCDEQKETHELCMDCVKKMIKENQQTEL